VIYRNRIYKNWLSLSITLGEAPNFNINNYLNYARDELQHFLFKILVIELHIKYRLWHFFCRVCLHFSYFSGFLIKLNVLSIIVD